MKKLLMSIRDVKADNFTSVWQSDNIATAMRTFVDVAHDAQSFVCRYPEDFGLYRLGEFDSTTGVIIPEPQPVHIMSGDEAIKSNKV